MLLPVLADVIAKLLFPICRLIFCIVVKLSSMHILSTCWTCVKSGHWNYFGCKRDDNPMPNQSSIIYIGETFRTFGEIYKEHLKHPSPIHHHCNQTGFPANHNNFQIIEMEGLNLARYIKESMSLGLIIPLLAMTLVSSIYPTSQIGLCLIIHG